MDPNPVWNRLEQLERLVVSQANEIELLKRNIQRINAQQSSLVELQRNDNDDMSSHRYSRPARYSSRPADHFVQSPPHVGFYDSPNRPTSHAANSYQMNSFVHPPTAIPPRGSARWQQPYQETLRLANGRPTATLRSPPRTPPIQSPPMSPINKQRWSAAPNLASYPNDDMDGEIGELGDFNDLDEPNVHHKLSRQRFVEPSCIVVATKKGPPALEGATCPTSEPDDEEIDVEKLTDGSDEHVEINVVSDDHAPAPPAPAAASPVAPPCPPPCPPPSTSIAVAVVENQQEIIRIQSDNSDSEVEEIGRIAPKPRKVLVERKPVKVVARNPHKKKRWTMVKFEPSANNSSSGPRRTYTRPTHTTTKIGHKSVPKKVRSRSKSPEIQDQSWIWSRDPSQKRLSLPTELKDIIRNSPF